MRPAPLRLRGLLHCALGYLSPVFLVTDLELMRTAGMDALVLCRFLALSTQFFLPITVVCCAARELRVAAASTGGARLLGAAAAPALL